MKLLTFTTLYPNAVSPQHGIFVETRLRELLKCDGVTARVIAPCPWFPTVLSSLSNHIRFVGIPRFETRYGIPIYHPRYPLLPKVSMSVAPFLLYYWTRHAVQRVLSNGYKFDIIDAHYMYPDGIAAMLLGRAFNRPVVITARGSDLNVLPNYSMPRWLIRWAAKNVAGCITVSDALREKLLKLGAMQDTVVTLRNGVDLELFLPQDREVCRRHLGLSEFTLLSVGNLVPLKGHDLAILVAHRLGNVQLLIVGEGPERRKLERLVLELGLQARVRFVGAVPQSNLPRIYTAADALLLASRHEGWPNVLVEAMACGTPVVSNAFESAYEIVRSPAAGRIAQERTPQALAEAVTALRLSAPKRIDTRRYAEAFGWPAVIEQQLQFYEHVIARHRGM